MNIEFGSLFVLIHQMVCMVQKPWQYAGLSSLDIPHIQPESDYEDKDELGEERIKEIR